jgi:hypothetical protein
MSDIVDLDAFVGAPRQARLGGQVYKFPRDIPAELYLEIHQLNQAAEEIDDATLIAKMHADVLELLQVHQPGMSRLPAAMSLTVLVRAIGAIYGADSAAEDDDDPEADPTPPKASGGKSQKPRTRSRSSS